MKEGRGVGWWKKKKQNRRTRMFLSSSSATSPKRLLDCVRAVTRQYLPTETYLASPIVALIANRDSQGRTFEWQSVALWRCHCRSYTESHRVTQSHTESHRARSAMQAEKITKKWLVRISNRVLRGFRSTHEGRKRCDAGEKPLVPGHSPTFGAYHYCSFSIHDADRW